MKIDMSKIMRIAHEQTKRIMKNVKGLNYHTQLGIMISESIRSEKLNITIINLRKFIKELRVSKNDLSLESIELSQAIIEKHLKLLSFWYSFNEIKNMCKDLINAYLGLTLQSENLTKEIHNIKHYNNQKIQLCEMIGQKQEVVFEQKFYR